MNIHTPERQPNESQADYRRRQKRSRAVSDYSNPIEPSRWLGNGKPISQRALHRARVAASKPPAPGPKLPKVRKHKQHHHELTDPNGVFTLVGRAPITGARRKWLAGISAMRRY